MVHGHQKHITEIRYTSAAQVRMAKALDHTIGVVVSPAAVPLVRAGARVRAQLHQAVRHAGPGEGMAMAAGADEGVDVVEGGVGGLLCEKDKWKADREKKMHVGHGNGVFHAEAQRTQRFPLRGTWLTILVVVGDPMQTFEQCFFPEVDEQSDPEVLQSQIGRSHSCRVRYFATGVYYAAGGDSLDSSATGAGTCRAAEEWFLECAAFISATGNERCHSAAESGRFHGRGER